MGRYHFIAIGGIGMSGLAKYLLEDGHTVSGSDMVDSKYVDKLRELGLYNIPEEENIDANNKQDDFDGLYGDVYYSAKKTLANTKMNILINMKKKYQSELLFPDTALQFYMGMLKAQIEAHCVDNEVVECYRLLVNQEKDYLKQEEWLNEQVMKINNDLKKPDKSREN